ncbi:MAG TPA: ABC transporter permease [Thermoanaerobaculia bacterium]|jgi:putative ABC transport system permease protein|nr:ABC transporter permease [Thermoanaerobaculia bacterium]
MSDLLHDIGYACRSLRRDPGFALAALLTLALGIGAAAAVFSVVNAVLLKPLPFAGQDRLAVVWAAQWKRDYTAIECSYPDYRDWKAQNKVFTDLAALSTSNIGMSLTGRGEPVQVDAATVTANLFPVLGVAPVLGRGFLAEEDRLGGRRVAVLGHHLWEEAFGRDPRVVGRQIRLNGDSYTVVGVMPASFHYPLGADLYVPLVPALGKENSELRLYRGLKAIGRLRPGATMRQATAEMHGLGRRLEAQYPFTNSGFSATVLPLTDEVLGNIRPTLILLFCGVSFLLLIAVANVANLLLARTLARRQEIGVRAALGADRGRVVRQLLTEGLVLGLLAGAGGLLLAELGIRSLARFAPQDLPRIAEVRLDPATLLFTVAISLVAVAGFGAALAFQAGRGDLHESLRGGNKGAAGSVKGTRLRRFLVVAEVSFALVLLIGTGLMERSVDRLQRVDPGFRRDHVLTLRLRLPEKSYPEIAQRQAFFDQLLTRVQALPGVVAAATLLARPLDEAICCDMPFAVEGQSRDEFYKNPYSLLQAVTPRYFQTMRTPILRGRAFDDHDREGAPPVAIVGRSLAQHYWPGQNPIGKRIRRVYSEDQTPWQTVVGVAEDVRYREWNQPRLDFYVPARQNPFAQYVNYQDLVIRTTNDPRAIVPPLRAAVHAIDPNQPVASVLTLDSLVDRALAGPRFTLLLMAVFGALALCLAAIGVYGILSYTVRQRSREIGIRMALGAKRPEVVRLVLAQGMRLTLAGLAGGLLAALVLTRFMASLVYEVSLLDPFTFFSAPVLLALIGLAATSIPALRAARADPVAVIRCD